MQTLTRAALSVGAAALIIGGSSGCAPEPRASSLPSATLTSTPMPSFEALPAENDLTVWAEDVLPENALGGNPIVLRNIGALHTGEPMRADVSQPQGLWEVAVACESVDGAPASLDLVQDGVSILVLDVPCFTVGDSDDEAAGDDVAGGGVGGDADVSDPGEGTTPSEEAPAGGSARVAFDGGHSSELFLTSSSEAVFVLQVYPGTPAAS